LIRSKTTIYTSYFQDSVQISSTPLCVIMAEESQYIPRQPLVRDF
jgi:hypothetical protein